MYLLSQKFYSNYNCYYSALDLPQLPQFCALVLILLHCLPFFQVSLDIEIANIIINIIVYFIDNVIVSITKLQSV